jgi:hypothetical protein
LRNASIALKQERKMNTNKESPHGTYRKIVTGVGGLFTPKSITTKGDKK